MYPVYEQLNLRKVVAASSGQFEKQHKLVIVVIPSKYTRSQQTNNKTVLSKNYLFNQS